MIYLIGSLRNPEVPSLAAALRELGHEVFDDWYAAGPEADDYWQRYEKERGHSFDEALAGYAAQHVFQYDKTHLDRASVGVLLLPAGKSGHLELGYLIGRGCPGFIIMPEEPERFDVMYNFADGVFFDQKNLFEALEKFLPENQVRWEGGLVSRPDLRPGSTNAHSGPRTNTEYSPF